jgi:PPOX class probable F420-dependent enzyme
MLRLSADDRTFLQEARVARLATASAAARPHLIPVCFVFDGMCLYTAIDAKPKRGDPRRLRRLQNLHENPWAALLVDHYAEDWTALRYLLATGPAEVLEAGPERDAAVALLREKYPQYRAMPGFGDGPVIRLLPEHVVSWQASPPGAGRTP